MHIRKLEKRQFLEIFMPTKVMTTTPNLPQPPPQPPTTYNEHQIPGYIDDKQLLVVVF